MVQKLFFACVLFVSLLNSASLEKVSIQLDWKYQFEFAGFIAAKEKGFYADAGLDVELREYQDNIDIVNDVLNQKASYGVYNSSLVVDDGHIKPIVLMATYFQHSPLVFVAQKGIKNPADMVGKTIMGTADEFKYSSLALMLSHFNISSKNARFVNHTFGIEEFAQKKVDVMSAFRSNQLYLLDKRGISYEIIDPGEYGFVMSAVNVFTSPQEALQHNERTRRFINATNEGWKYALDHPEEVVDMLISRYHAKKSKDALLYEAKITKSLMLREFYPIGEVNGELTQRAFKQLMQGGLLAPTETLGTFMFQEIEKQHHKNKIFTPQERKYLSQKQKITLCVDPQWLPIEMIEGGKHVGMAADVFGLFQQQLQIPIELVPTDSWQQSLQYAQNRRCDLISLSQPRPEREKYLKFTSKIFSFPYVIVTQNDKLFIDDLSKLEGKKIAEVKSYAILEQFNPMSKIERVEVDSITEGLNKVESGEVYGYIDNLAAVSSYLQREYPGILKVSMRLNFNDDLSIGVRSDDPQLYAIFEKMVTSLDETQRQKIYNRWLAVTEEVPYVDYPLIAKTILFLLALGALLSWRMWELKKYNAKLFELSITDKLTTLFNRQKIDSILMQEYTQVLRYPDYHCSVMMIDIDFFKLINDTLGHQVGDRVLIQISEVFKTSLRQTDRIGRWGGEEFMVILPHTTMDQALKTAEHLRKTVENYPFGIDNTLTISIGLGEIQKGLSVHENIARIDQALYQAKRSGRNLVIQANG